MNQQTLTAINPVLLDASKVRACPDSAASLQCARSDVRLSTGSNYDHKGIKCNFGILHVAFFRYCDLLVSELS